MDVFLRNEISSIFNFDGNFLMKYAMGVNTQVNIQGIRIFPENMVFVQAQPMVFVNFCRY